jgi:hypothetical protein
VSLEEDLALTRKLVGDGVSISEDVEQVLMPILSIRHQSSTAQIEEENPLSRLSAWSGQAKRLLEAHASSATELIEALLGDQR